MVVAEEFANITGSEAVMAFGSWAARYLGEPGRAPNDVDVLVIGSADPDEVDDAAERVERRIGMPVHATVRTRLQWESESESFIREVKSRPMLIVLANDEQHFGSELGGLRTSARFAQTSKPHRVPRR